MHLGKDANASAYKALLKTVRAVEATSTSTMHIHRENKKKRAHMYTRRATCKQHKQNTGIAKVPFHS